MRFGWVVVVFVIAAGAVAQVQAQVHPCQPGQGIEEVLHQLNAVRAGARSCGTAAVPLRWDTRLAASAQAYAEELARRDTLSHQGQRSGSLRERLHQAGYRMRQSGENLAAGPETLEQALEQWLASPGHCDNLMFQDFKDMGLACVAAPGRYGRFWVLHLGRSAAD